VVFENYPAEAALEARARESRGLEVGAVQAVEQTNYALTVVAGEAGRLWLRLSYDRGRLAGSEARLLAGRLARALVGLAEDAGRGLSEV
jgi:hypothetical protein